jgi:hypothetical protein
MRDVVNLSLLVRHQVLIYGGEDEEKKKKELVMEREEKGI